MSRCRPRLWTPGAGLPTLALVALIAGCRPPLSPSRQPSVAERPSSASTADLLASSYEDLRGRRFHVLADFETAEQADAFTIEPPDAGVVSISTERARVDTGLGSLKVSLTAGPARVVARDSPEASSTWLRDWSPYHLLLINVYSPRELVGLILRVRSGTDPPLAYERRDILIEPGWNLLRIDLGDVGDHIDLTDIRELRFGCDSLDERLDLHLDDLVLADNSRNLFQSPVGEDGRLYVMAHGRRLVVGAVRRFEQVFARGGIRRWYDLAHDPTRMHNLAGLGAIGPNPVVVPPGSRKRVVVDDPSQWAPLGAGVQAYQTLVDADPLRAVIESEWRFSPPDQPPDEQSPYHRWVYAVYHDGRVYIECTGHARAPGLDNAGVAVAFCCDSHCGFQRQIAEETKKGVRRGRGETAHFLFARASPDEADLLVVPHARLAAAALENPNDPRVCAMWTVPIDGTMFAFSALMRVQPADMESAERSRDFTLDYCHPLPLAIDAGRLVLTDPGDYDHDGFNESRGCYVLQLDRDQARLRLGGPERPRFSPVFKLVEVADREIWVYVDGLQLKETHRDQEGNVWFEVRGTLLRETLLEISSRAREARTP